MLVFSGVLFAQRYTESRFSYDTILVGPGPEDMVLDTASGMPRLLISCCERRSDQPTQSQIWYYQPGSGETGILPRLHHPDSILFHPHGMDLGWVGNKRCLLVVNHEEKKKRHSVLRYWVYPDRLEFDTLFCSPLIVSPNDVLAGDNGAFWITNDASSRNSMLELILKIKGGSVVYFDGRKTFSYAARGFAYPNGLIRMDNTFFLSTTRQNKVLMMPVGADGRLDKKRKQVWARATGWDNITAASDTLLLSTAHVKPMRFVKHARHPEAISPVAVYTFSAQRPGQQLLFYTDGRVISAGSTAVLYRGHLYIAQVFNPFIADIRLN